LGVFVAVEVGWGVGQNEINRRMRRRSRSQSVVYVVFFVIALALAVTTGHFVPWACTVLIGVGLVLFLVATERHCRDEPA
jgi:fatty acid desaturase